MALESLFVTPPPLVNSINETLSKSETEKSVFERDEEDAEEGEILEDGELPESDGEGDKSVSGDNDTQPIEDDPTPAENKEEDVDGVSDQQVGGQSSFGDEEIQQEDEDVEPVSEYHHRSSHRKKRKKKHRREKAKRRRRHRSGSAEEDVTPPGSPNTQENFLDRSYPPRRSGSRYDSPPDYDTPPEEEFGGMPRQSRGRSQGYFVPPDYWEDEDDDEDEGRKRGRDVAKEEEDRYDSEEEGEQYQDMLSHSEVPTHGRGTGRFQMPGRGKGKGRGRGRGAQGSHGGGSGIGQASGMVDGEDNMEEMNVPMGRGKGGARGRGGKGKGGKGRGKAMMDNQMQQRPICKFYLDGKCNKGANCTFSHAVSQNKKMEQCKFYIQGHCHKGDDCLFIHGDMPCKYFHTGAVCYQGENCKFSHKPLTEHTRLLLGKVLKGGLQDVYGPEIQRQPHQTRGLLPHPTQGGKKIPSLFEIKTQLVGEEGRRIAELEKEREMELMQKFNFYGSSSSQFDNGQMQPETPSQQSQSQQPDDFQGSPDQSEQQDFSDSQREPQRTQQFLNQSQQPFQRDNKSFQGGSPPDPNKPHQVLIQHQQGRPEESQDKMEPVVLQQKQQQQQQQQVKLPPHLQRLGQNPLASPQHPQQSPQHIQMSPPQSQGSPARPQVQPYLQRPTDPSLLQLRPAGDPLDNYDHGDIDMRRPRTKHNSEMDGLVIDTPETPTERDQEERVWELDKDDRFSQEDARLKMQMEQELGKLSEGDDSEALSSDQSQGNQEILESADGRKTGLASVTLNMPAKQRALFMRIQQKQAESSEEGEDGERQQEAKKKTEGELKEKDASRDDDNWYSSDEDDEGGSLPSAIKTVQEKSSSQTDILGSDKPSAAQQQQQQQQQQAPDSLLYQQQSLGQQTLLPNALASLFSAKPPTVGQASDPSVLAQQNALSSILSLVGKTASTNQQPNLLMGQKPDQPVLPGAGGDGLLNSKKITEFILLEIIHSDKLKDPRADREKKDKSDLRLRKLLWKDNEYTINDTESRPTLAPIELLTPTELKSHPDFAGTSQPSTAAPTAPQLDPRPARPADPRTHRPRDPRTQSVENNQAVIEQAPQPPRDPRLASRDPRLNAGGSANQNQGPDGPENQAKQGGLLPTPQVGVPPPGILPFPQGGPFGPQGPHMAGMHPPNANFPPFPNGRFPVRFPPGGPPGNMNQRPRFPTHGPPGPPMRNMRPRFPQQGMPFRGHMFGDSPNRIPLPNRMPGPNRGPPPNMGQQHMRGPGPPHLMGPHARGPMPIRGPAMLRGASNNGQRMPVNDSQNIESPPGATMNPAASKDPRLARQLQQQGNNSPQQNPNIGTSGAGDATLPVPQQPPLGPRLQQNPGFSSPPQGAPQGVNAAGPRLSLQQLGSTPPSRGPEQTSAEPVETKQTGGKPSDPRLIRQLSQPKLGDLKNQTEATSLIRQNSAPAASPGPEEKEKSFPKEELTPASPTTTKPGGNPKEPPLILRIRLRGENDKPEIARPVSDSGSDSELLVRKSKRARGSGSDSDHTGGLPESRKRPPKSALAGFSIPKIPKKADKTDVDTSSDDSSKPVVSSGTIEHRQVPSAHHRVPQITSSFNQSVARPPANPNQTAPVVRTNKIESAAGTPVVTPSVNPQKIDSEMVAPSNIPVVPPDDISLKDMFTIKDPTASPFC